MLFKLLLLMLIWQGCIAPPVTKNKSDSKENAQETGLEDYMEYHRYLKEVVDALESDPQFRDKLEKAEESDIRSGKIAHELEFVSHKVRSRLDEIKRAELERLRHFASKQYEIENGLNESQGKVGAMHPDKQHVDHVNPHTFEIEDLKKLISKSTQDLAEADKKRREEFKQYEMQKEFEKQEKLKSMDETHRNDLEKQLKEQEEKHKKHVPLHHPGSKQQLEEVWEKQDHMEQQDFDPKTFFMLHDLDGNGVWDENEVKTLFIKELDKMYNEGAPEDDMRERIEEMERMREHVFSEVDRNKDGLISYDEFLDQTRKQDFQEDKGWEGLDQQKVYTEEEYKQFEKRQIEEVERLIAQGMLLPHPGGPMYHDPRMPPNGQFPPQHAGQVAQGYQYNPGQMPPHGGQMPPHGGQIPPHGGQMPPHGGQISPHGQMPLHGQIPQQGQMQHNQISNEQIPSGQYHPGQGQIPVQQHQQGQVPVQQHQQGQVPVQQHPGRMQQQQFQQGQVPHQANQLNNQPNQVPNQGNPVNQGQQPPLNTNEVYSNNIQNQIPKQQKPQQILQQQQGTGQVQNQNQIQNNKPVESPQVQLV